MEGVPMTESDLDQVIEQYHQALDALTQGNPDPVIEILSKSNDVSLANPTTPISLGRKQVEETLVRVAAMMRDGKHDQIETIAKMVTPDMAYFLRIERGKARFGDKATLDAFALRVTVVFRREDGTWKLVHRHADPILSERTIESVILK